MTGPSYFFTGLQAVFAIEKPEISILESGFVSRMDIFLTPTYADGHRNIR
jgi:hypothetical protein